MLLAPHAVAGRVLVGFSFRAKHGKAEEMRRLLSDPDGARRVAQAMGATRNLLFFQGDRMVRVLEFPDGVRPVPMADLAAKDPAMREFLRRIGELAEPGFDPEVPGSLDAFNRAVGLELVYDVRA